MRTNFDNPVRKTLRLEVTITRYGEGLFGRYTVIEEGRIGLAGCEASWLSEGAGLARSNAIPPVALEMGFAYGSTHPTRSISIISGLQIYLRWFDNCQHSRQLESFL